MNLEKAVNHGEIQGLARPYLFTRLVKWIVSVTIRFSQCSPWLK